MKLFLSSAALTSPQSRALLKLSGKSDTHDVRLALIENAAHPYPEYKRYWMHESRQSIIEQGYDVELIDLDAFRDTPEALAERLQNADIIWLGGGNVFYLRWILAETGTDALLTQFARTDKVIAGSSAGAIVLGPTLRNFDAADNPALADRVIYEGLGLTDIATLPHWDTVKFGERMKKIDHLFAQDGVKTQRLTDSQALIIHDTNELLIES